MSEMSEMLDERVCPVGPKGIPKQFNCMLCPYTTARKDNLKRHSSTNHPVPVPAPVPEVPAEVPVVNELQLVKDELAKLRSEFEAFVFKFSAPVPPIGDAPKPKPKRKSKANKPVVGVAADELKEEVIL
jgi:hypothetical protein